MMIRCSARAASTALIDFSRETESGRMMNGKTTTSFSGRTGSMSGIGSSAPRSAGAGALFFFFLFLFLFLFDLGHPGLLLRFGGHGNLDLLLAQVGHPGQENLEQPVFHS